jgi:RimJ/RimL family protein N-acetyltransferase
MTLSRMRQGLFQFIGGFPMLTLRPYRPEDAETIVSWIRDKETMHRLAANLYDTFPVTAEMMNRQYENYKSTHNILAFTALDEENRIAGHFAYLFKPEDPDTARICFVIVDDSRRGHGLGSRMLPMAVYYARETLQAKKITLCVFANNPSAHRCYLKSGFRDLEPVRQVPIMGEIWDCIDMQWYPTEEPWN